MDKRLPNILHALKPNSRSILFVDDLPIEQALALHQNDVDEESYVVEGRIFELFDVLCVYNKAAQRAIGDRYSISDEKFVEIGMRDYGVSPKRSQVTHKPFPRKWTLMYIGSGDKMYAGEWPMNLPRSENVGYEFIGSGWEWISELNRPDFVWKPSMEQQELCDYLAANADFGVVAYSDQINEYSKYICPSKFATYLSSGIPVIAASQCEYVAQLVTKYGIGLSLASFNDMSTRLGELTEPKDLDMRRRAAQLAEAVHAGYFYNRGYRGYADASLAVGSKTSLGSRSLIRIFSMSVTAWQIVLTKSAPSD